MKKVVRLNESDIVRLVKKVIIENKRMINEDYVAGATFTIDGSGPFIKINGKKFKTTINSSLYNGDVVITSVKEQAGTLYGTNVCITTNAKQNQCFDIKEAQKLVDQVNQGKTWIEMGNSLGKVIFQAWQ
jgi:hypothetical protein